MDSTKYYIQSVSIINGSSFVISKQLKQSQKSSSMKSFCLSVLCIQYPVHTYNKHNWNILRSKNTTFELCTSGKKQYLTVHGQIQNRLRNKIARRNGCQFGIWFLKMSTIWPSTLKYCLLSSGEGNSTVVLTRTQSNEPYTQVMTYLPHLCIAFKSTDFCLRLHFFCLDGYLVLN